MPSPFLSEHQPIVIYHNHCLDGFTAAWVAHNALEKVHAVPMLVADDYTTGLCSKPIDQWPFSVKGRDIYIVDFSYPADTLKQLCEEANDVVVIDHHESAIKKLAEAFPKLTDIPDNLTLILSKDNSGAGLTWGYFNYHIPMPDVVKYVEDRDLWRFAFEDTKAYCAALGQREKVIAEWDNLCSYEETQRMIVEGNVILQMTESHMRSLMRNVSIRSVGGHLVPVINCPAFLASEMGSHMMKMLNPLFAVTYADDGLKRRWSLRSVDSALDVRVIAETLGGGGHRNAAGFVTALDFMFAGIHAVGGSNDQD